jgi:hypothetical protein
MYLELHYIGIYLELHYIGMYLELHYTYRNIPHDQANGIPLFEAYCAV